MFTTAEKRAFEAKQAEREREIETKKKKEELLSNTKINLMQLAAGQQAPASILSAIQNAKTPEDAISAAGKYSGDVLARTLKLSQIHAQKMENEAAEAALLKLQNNITSGGYTPDQGCE